jgi:hypothetical protein
MESDDVSEVCTAFPTCHNRTKYNTETKPIKHVTGKINFKRAILTSFKKINYSLEGLFNLATS